MVGSGLKSAFRKARGRRVLMVLGSFPYFLIGKIKGAFAGGVLVTMDEGVCRELTGTPVVVGDSDIVMFYIEGFPGELPSLADPQAPLATPAVSSGVARHRILQAGSNPGLAYTFAARLDEGVILSLKPPQVNILGQVFRPIVAGTVRHVCPDYVLLHPVILKIPTAPQHVFPTPLAIPYAQIAEVVLAPAETNFPLP